MKVDWVIVATIVAPLLAALFGAWLSRWFESRPKILVWYSHRSEFDVKNEPQEGEPIRVHTHAVNLKNTGKKSAKDIVVSHNYLPTNFRIIPPTPHRVEELPGGGKNIVIPNLVPNKEISISYLYYPPVTWAQINTAVEFDEGMAKVIDVIPTPSVPKSLQCVAFAMMFIGTVTTLYLVAELFNTLIA
ncbi:hypothetical protein GNP61_19520 [Aliivibrio fischeri]|uniref:hypothetical protein n=1 Tax=Aliivibrio fischeri TaxID=668 RepID=UPI0012DA9EF5|nr:hypothetical protein [Aliivibrio fischeri]MUK43732.1 hypothetical protein [Aliivibrio fischeri]